MSRRHITTILAFACMILPGLNARAQETNWYLLKSAGSLSEIQVKEAISQIQQIAPETIGWYNGDHSNTFGFKSETAVEWHTVIPLLYNSGIYLAEITKGEFHHHGAEAITSIFYQRALYYSIFPANMPAEFIAELNQDEWSALPETAVDFFEEQENLIISAK